LNDAVRVVTDHTSARDRSMRRASKPMLDATGLERVVYRNRKMELFVWSSNGLTKAFELHYGINADDEWSVLWTERDGTSFHRVDANGMGPDAARAMIPTEARQLPIADLHAEFVIRSRFIDEPVRRRVLICLSQATSYAHES